MHFSSALLLLVKPLIQIVDQKGRSLMRDPMLKHRATTSVRLQVVPGQVSASQQLYHRFRDVLLHHLPSRFQAQREGLIDLDLDTDILPVETVRS